MRKISAPLIYNGKGQIYQDHVVLINDDMVLDLVPISSMQNDDIEFYNGVICPGFINAHCHLELSHLKGIIPKGTGLTSFLEKVVTLRSFPQEVIQKAIKDAMTEMEKGGIVALGDICNTTDTDNIKLESSMLSSNFIECFDLFQSNSIEQFNQFKSVFDSFKIKDQDKKNIVPHAPYSVSRLLFRNLMESQAKGGTLSIHNQETQDENQFSLDGEGALRQFYSNLDLSLDRYQPCGKNSIEYTLEHVGVDQNILLVHNTMTSSADIQKAHDHSNNVFWCTCPNANLYIENQLPIYSHFIEHEGKMCIGTDSLSSNEQLSIIEEMKTIQKYNPAISLGQLITWATYNGALALGFDEKIGSIEKGKKPGLNHLNIDPKTKLLTANTQVEKIL